MKRLEGMNAHEFTAAEYNFMLTQLSDEERKALFDQGLTNRSAAIREQAEVYEAVARFKDVLGRPDEAAQCRALAAETLAAL